MPRLFSGKSENDDGCLVTTVLYLKRMGIVTAVMTQMSVEKIVLVRLCPKIEYQGYVFGHIQMTIKSKLRFRIGENCEGLTIASLCPVDHQACTRRALS